MGLLTDLRASISRATSSLFAGSEPKRIGIYGPPNAGKCLAAGETVTLADGTHRRIEEVFESVRSDGAPDLADDPHETWLDCEDQGIRVPALTDGLDVRPAQVTHAFRQRYVGEMYRVRTRYGREVTVSPEHPFVALTEDGVEHVRAADLSEESRVALCSSYDPEPSDWTLDDAPELASDGGTVTYRSAHHDPKPVVPHSIDPDTARFLALTIAESQHDERFVAFTNEDPALREEFRRLSERFGIETTTYDYEGKTPTVRANSRSLVEHLRRLDCPPGASADKRVPGSVMTADDRTVRAFLRAMFDCEGSVQGADGDERGRYVTMASASRELLVGVQTLLLRFGIVGKIRSKDHDGETYYEFAIGRSDQHRAFRERVGFDDEEKARRLDRLCEAGSSATAGTLPVMPALEEAREALGMTQADFYGDDDHVARMRRRNSITPDRVESMADALPRREETDLLHDLATADVTWDRVTDVETVEYDGYIYDLTVADHHTFTTGDGLIVHNTTLANRIARDWTGDAVGPESHVPHETRRARRKENVEIKRNGKSVTIDIVDTPGVATKVDYTEFLEHDIEKDDAVRRSREATEGVAEAMHWLREDVDGVIYVLDAAEDPFTQVNTMLIGIIESQDLPVLIFANKIDLEEASVQRIRNAFPQHETVPLSALEGDNMDEVYDKIAEYFA
jgi:hypothetical protein